MLVDAGGATVTVTVNPFPKFKYPHDGIFSFTMQYSLDGGSNWNSGIQNNIYANYVNTNITGYIGGRIPGVISFSSGIVVVVAALIYLNHTVSMY